MKIKNIKRFAFLVLLLLPLLVAIFNSLWLVGDKSNFIAQDWQNVVFADVFTENLRNALPDNDIESYVCIALNKCCALLVGSVDYDFGLVVTYVAYGVNLFLLWVVVDCFIALPLILKRFIDRGVYRD